MDAAGGKRDYLKWRMSDEGKAYFSRKEENAFYIALMKGNTSVIDTGIKEKQAKIKKLKRELGLSIILICLVCAGCTTYYTIPENKPSMAEESLKTGEHTYVVKDMRASTPDGKNIVLDGNWHIVSQDFMKDHVANQNDLISTLELLKKERKVRSLYKYCILGICIALVGYISIKKKGSSV